jgi:hypothetical protein
MTIGELVRQLQTMDQDMLVVQTRYGNNRGDIYYETFDGWWPQYATVARSNDHEGIYREAVEGEEALTI